MSIVTRRAHVGDVEALALLFNEYRLFHDCCSNLKGAKAFIQARLTEGDSVTFVAERESGLVGFAQLYPSFSSLQMKRMWILSALYVSGQERGTGVGRALLQNARNLALSTEAKSLVLQVAVGNEPARAAYEASGWRQEEDFHVFVLDV